MDTKELIINVESLTGKNRSKSSRTTFLCLGILDMTKDDQNKSAIKLDDNGWKIDKYRCSKCYLCKLKSKYIALDKDNFPYVTDREVNEKYEISFEDQIHFESCLADYDEKSGISKWIYSIFRLFDINETYTECAISKEYIPKEILKKLGRFRADGIYGKSSIPDVEGKINEFVFVFENKKFSTANDNWIIDAVKQIILYASSEIYQKRKNNITFIFCYNGSYNIRGRVVKIIKENPELKILYEVFDKKPNYSFSLIPSSEFFNLIKDSIKNNKKDKQKIIDLILSKKENFPLK
ncbi:hypothetical protein J4234_04765 [Candidatus Woesearchaeota archaeon]|nr:hypothetical protein [Candidatus Woesearchaeota archaeon]